MDIGSVVKCCTRIWTTRIWTTCSILVEQPEMRARSKFGKPRVVLCFSYSYVFIQVVCLSKKWEERERQGKKSQPLAASGKEEGDI